jgi:hypothetical protein
LRVKQLSAADSSGGHTVPSEVTASLALSANVPAAEDIDVSASAKNPAHAALNTTRTIRLMSSAVEHAAGRESSRGTEGDGASFSSGRRVREPLPLDVEASVLRREHGPGVAHRYDRGGLDRIAVSEVSANER